MLFHLIEEAASLLDYDDTSGLNSVWDNSQALQCDYVFSVPSLLLARAG